MIKSHIETNPLSQRYHKLRTHRDTRQNSLRNILEQSTSRFAEAPFKKSTSSANLSYSKQKQPVHQKRIVHNIPMLQLDSIPNFRLNTDYSNQKNQNIVDSPRSKSKFEIFMQKSKEHNVSLVQLYAKIKQNKDISTYRKSSKNTNRVYLSNQMSDFGKTKSSKQISEIVKYSQGKTSHKKLIDYKQQRLNSIESKHQQSGTKIIMTKTKEKDNKIDEEMWKQKSDLGDLGSLSTLKKSQFLRNQVIKQWKINELTQSNDKCVTSLVPGSKFMQDLQKATLKPQPNQTSNISYDNFSQIDGEYNHNAADVDRSASKSSIVWPSSDKKQRIKFSITPKKITKPGDLVSKNSSKEGLRILEYSEASQSYDFKRQSIVSRLVEKLDEIKTSTEKRQGFNTDFVTESMCSRVYDHKSIIRKLDYKNQDELTIQVPKIPKSTISQSFATFGLNKNNSLESDEDDQSKYQIELSF